jgi:hypothetical protein
MINAIIVRNISLYFILFLVLIFVQPLNVSK